MNALQHLEITQMLNKAACALDERDFDGMALCFTEDTSVTIQVNSTGLSEPLAGRDALMGLVRARVAEQTDKRRHVISNVLIEPETAERARATSFLTLIAVASGKAGVLTTGCYRDVVIRRDGRWQIASRVIELDLPY